MIPLQSDAQLYKQAGNGVTVNVVEAIGRRLAEAHFQARKKKLSCRAQICGILLSEQKEGEPPWPVMLKQSPIGSLSP